MIFPKKLIQKIARAVFVCAFFVFSSSCFSSHKTLIKTYGADVNYFLALEALQKNETERAKVFFEKAIAKGSYFAKRRSIEKLLTVGNVQERVFNAERLVQFSDENALSLAVKEFLDAGEYAKILESVKLIERYKNGVDFSACSDEVARCVLVAMAEKKDVRFWQSVYEWFTEKPISSEHQKFYADILKQKFADAETFHVFSLVKNIVEFRMSVFEKKYKNAYTESKNIKKLFIDADKIDATEKYKIALPHLVVSDAGKAFLYSENFSASDVNFFVEIADRYADNFLVSFYAYFYAARLSEKNGSLLTAQNFYQCAMTAALALGDGERYDNALWYFLSSIPLNDTAQIIGALKNNCANWHSAEYFDDFLSRLVYALVSKVHVSDFKILADTIENYASPEIVAQYAYVYARLLETRYVASKIEKAEVQKYLEKAFAYSRSYYAVMAGVKLGLSSDKIISHLCAGQVSAPKNNSKKLLEKSKDEKSDLVQAEFCGATKDEIKNSAENIIKGYAEFGFAELIYDEWKSFFDDGIYFSSETNLLLAKFLWQCAAADNKFFPQSIRIASRSYRKSATAVSKEFLKNVYPKDYEKEVCTAAKKFGIEPEVLFALIRTESFFDANIKSHAGAVGLTQLMDFTAQDVAKRLKIQNYDVTNPADSITFGAYYFADLCKRLDDSVPLALCAYNAGITRVRRWKKSIEQNLRGDFAKNCDLFLEMIPYEETRGYAKSVIGASAIYGMLYYDKTAKQIVDEVF